MAQRKFRSQSKLGQLPESQREELHGWLVENLTYADIRTRLQERFNVSTSTTAIGDYYRRLGAALLPKPTGEVGRKDIVIPPGWEAVFRGGPPATISLRPQAG